VSKADAVHAGAPGGPPYFSISARKLAVLLLCTGGAYSLVWLYHNWWAIRLRSGQKLSPIHRSLLFFVFLYPLLKGMRVSAEVVGVKAKFSPVAIAVSMPPILWLARLDDLLWPLVYVGVAPLNDRPRFGVGRIGVRLQDEHVDGLSDGRVGIV
jgi:hypothetical protein